MRKFALLIFNLILTFSLLGQNQIKMTSVNLNLRTSPWVGKNVICVIPKETLITVNNSSQTYGEWAKINYNGRLGYVYLKYIKDPVFKNNNVAYDYNKTGSSIKYYTNSKGEKVQSPTYYDSPPTGATAECRDGTYSFSRSRRGTCSHHGGVKRWLK